MSFKIGVGKSDFADIRKAGLYYVDKSQLIYELVGENDNEVTLFTRPRRFGKTLMMSMMENFFDIKKDSRKLFEGLKIAEREDFCENWMNQYPVVSLSFKDVDGSDYDTAFKKLKAVMADLCKKMEDLGNERAVNPFDREIFLRLQAKTADIEEVQNALKTIMRMLNAVYGKQVILLIDEYDVPLAKAGERDEQGSGYYAQMLDVIKGIMSAALKDNEYLKFAVVTGCLRIAKESIFTGTNNFSSYSVLDDEFSGYFGFTEEEVKCMLAAAGREEKADIIREWYDGYVFGDNLLYCPWDVINYLSALKKNESAKPKNYWKNTSHNGILLSFVEKTDFPVSEKFEKLMNGETVTQVISDELTYDTLHSSEDNLWSVLLMTGYVTKTDGDREGDSVCLKIPNREIAAIFQDTVITYFNDNLDDAEQKNLMKALWDGDADTASRLFSDLLWQTISYNDYHEDYYHAFLAGIFVGRGYEVESNKETGLGRPDILLFDRPNRRAIIIEAKKSKKKDDMGKDCEEALKQIEAQQYAAGLEGYETIRCFGVSFFRKQALVKC